MKSLYVLALSLLISACGGDNADAEEEPREVISCESRICSDHSGDSDFSFIDITDVQIKFENSNIIVDITLLDIPATFTYSSANVPENYLEYSWRISFDVDGDSSTSNDISLDVAYFKNSEDIDLMGSLLDFTQHDIWQNDNDGMTARTIGPVIVTQDNTTLTFTVAKSSHAALEGIDETTPFKVLTTYNAAGTFYQDNFPDYEGYIY